MTSFLKAIFAVYLLSNIVATSFAQDDGGVQPMFNLNPKKSDEPVLREFDDPVKVQQFKDFDAAVDHWKEIMVQLFEIRNEYQYAKHDEHAPMRKKWRILINEGDAVLRQLLPMGIAKFKDLETPDPDLGAFLEITARKLSTNGHHEIAAEAFSLVRQANLPISPKSLVPAAVSAYSTSRFDEAILYFKEAIKQKQFQKESEKEVEKSKFLYGLLNGIENGRKQWQADQLLVTLEQEKGDLPQARIVTTGGSLLVELYENDAPNTVAHFISLAEKKFFDDRMINLSNNGEIHLGAPNPDGTGGPGYTVHKEATPELCRPIFRGNLFFRQESQEQQTFGSKFAIAKIPMVGLKGRATCFGKVIGGFENIEDIHGFARPAPEDDEFYPEPDKIIKVEILRKREHEYKPVKVGDEPEPVKQKPQVDSPTSVKDAIND